MPMSRVDMLLMLHSRVDSDQLDCIHRWTNHRLHRGKSLALAVPFPTRVSPEACIILHNVVHIWLLLFAPETRGPPLT